MPIPKDSSDISSATGFDFGFNDRLQVLKKAPAFTRSSSVPHLPSHNDRFSIETQLKPARFFSASQSVRSVKTYNPRPYFRSRRIKKGTVDRPELREKDPRGIWITLIPAFGFFIGLSAIALLSWSGYSSVSNHRYCEVFVDDFSDGFNSTIWTKHVETGGYG